MPVIFLCLPHPYPTHLLGLQASIAFWGECVAGELNSGLQTFLASSLPPWATSPAWYQLCQVVSVLHIWVYSRTFFSFFLFVAYITCVVCTCDVCLYVYNCKCTCVHMYVEVQCWCWVSPLIAFPLIYWGRQGLSLLAGLANPTG